MEEALCAAALADGKHMFSVALILYTEIITTEFLKLNNQV